MGWAVWAGWITKPHHSKPFSPTAFAESCDWRPDLPEPFSAILDRGTPDFDEPLDPNRSERNNNRYGANLTLIALSALLMWVFSSRTGLVEPGALTHPIALESIVPVFPLVIFAISLLVTVWNPALGGKLLWGAFATPFLIHLARTARPVAKTQGK